MSIFQEEPEPQAPSAARVSIIERVVPAISFGLASLSGVTAAVMTTSMFTSLREEENAGAESIIAAFDAVQTAVLSLLGLSITVGVAAIITSLVRRSTHRLNASPPGFAYVLSGLPNLVSPLLVVYSWFIVVEVVAGRYVGDVTQGGARIAEILIFALLAGIGSVLILPVFAFAPFKARPGPKISSIICLSIVVGCIVLIAIAFLGVADGLIRIPAQRPI